MNAQVTQVKNNSSDSRRYFKTVYITFHYVSVLYVCLFVDMGRPRPGSGRCSDALVCTVLYVWCCKRNPLRRRKVPTPLPNFWFFLNNFLLSSNLVLKKIVVAVLSTFCRVVYVAAREGHLPEMLSYVQCKYYTPFPSIIFTVSQTQYFVICRF